MSRPLTFNIRLIYCLLMQRSDMMRQISTAWALACAKTVWSTEGCRLLLTRFDIMSSWIGFINATDKQKIQAFVKRSKNAGYCNAELNDFEALCAKADNELFQKILNNLDHVLQPLLPPPVVQNYNLRSRSHNFKMHSVISTIKRLIDWFKLLNV